LSSDNHSKSISDYWTDERLANPQYNYNYRPYGTWVARRLSTLNGWIQQGDFNYDMAMVRLKPLNGRYIQDALGAQGIAFNYPHSAVAYSFG
ncbi:unnamed protein product, partial [Didymodactylos carnosus]